MARSEAETSMLGGLLLDASLVAAGRVTVDLFQDGEAREMFRAIEGLVNAGRPVNGETVAAEVEGKVKSSTMVSVSGCATAANIEWYLERLTADRKRRELRSLSLWLQDATERGASPDEMEEGLEARLGALRRTVVDTHDVDVHETLHSIVATLEDRRRNGVTGPSGIRTGLTELDARLGGLQPGESYLLAARTSKGKSALAMTIADGVLRQKIPVAFCSLEMSAKEIMERWLAIRSGVPMSRMRNGTLLDQDWHHVMEAAGSFNGNLKLLDQPVLSPRGLRAWAHGVVAKGARLVVVDYLGLLDVGGDPRPRWESMGDVSRLVKQLARELHVPLLSLVQINRMGGQDAEPDLATLRDSGSFEQDADVVMLLHQADPKDCGAIVRAVVNVAKNRNGPIGRIHLAFDRSCTRFTDWREDE